MAGSSFSTAAAAATAASGPPGGGGKEGHPPRASTASPMLGLAQGSGSGSGWSGTGSGRASPLSSGGLESSSAGSVLGSSSCNSYEYIESDQD